MSWGVFEIDEQVHVVPLVDAPASPEGRKWDENAGDHVARIDCWCGPRTEQWGALLIIHNAFDN